MKLSAVLITCYTLISLCSCSHLNNDCSYGTNVKLINKSGYDLQIELKALTGTPLKASMPATVHQLDTVLCFDKVAKTDGHYNIHIKNAVLDTTYSFGYYSNGVPQSAAIDVAVYPTTFSINASIQTKQP